MKNTAKNRILTGALAVALAVGTAGTSLAATAAAYQPGYESKQDANYAGAELNEQIAQEGMVLLKNDDSALPLEPGKITVLGYNSVAPLGGGSSEGGDMSAGVTRLQADIYSSLTDAGYEINPVVEEQYRAWLADGKTGDYLMREDFNNSAEDFEESIGEYGEAAVVVISATAAYPTVGIMGGLLQQKEGDGKMMLADAVPEGDSEERAHSLMLDASQHELLQYANDNFDTVVLVVNNSTPIELGFLKDGTYPNLKAAVLAGAPGGNGFNALGQILNGSVNPSGRLVDIYPADFTTMPTWVNYGNNGTAYDYGEAGLDGAYTMAPIEAGGNGYIDAEGNARSAMFTDYEEGIYIGYRYFETRGFTDGEDWYGENVVFPFGYGLSYTDFDWEVVSASHEDGADITEADAVEIEVEVTNTGDAAGKDVVEVYFTAPYNDGGIEKSHVVLADYAKTGVIEPGESETVTLSFSAFDMASYDWDDKNENGFKGYELEAGEYQIKLMRNSHDAVSSFALNVGEDIACATSPATGSTIENRFDYVNDVITESADKTVLSRADWEGTWPEVPVINEEDPTQDGRYLSDEDFANWTLSVSEDADAAAPWKADEAPVIADAAERPEAAEVVLSDLTGLDYDDPLWDELLNELTLEEIMGLINVAGFGTLEIPYIEKPFAFDTDGPKGWSGTGVGGEAFTSFAAEPVLASTWSKDLAYQMGVVIGEQALWGNSDAGEGIKTYSGWYAPGMNTHRVPLDSRYTEYYSEDGYLAGTFAASVIEGARTKGVYVTIKHFALHENGDFIYRGMMSGDGAETTGLSIWVNEQAMRELYFKPFQITVEDAGAGAAMSSFSRIGYTWAGASYPLLTELLRNEWGFEGFVLTDIEIYPFMIADAMVRAGGDAVLSSGRQEPRQVTESNGDEATHIASLRLAAKNILFTVANSNAMQIPQGAAVVYEAVEIDEATSGEEYTAALGEAYLNTVTSYSTVSYSLTDGELPSGLTLDGATGELTGTPDGAGTYAFEITASAEGYVSAAVGYSLTVQ